MLIHVVHLELEREIRYSSFKYNEDDLLEIDSMFLLNYKPTWIIEQQQQLLFSVGGLRVWAWLRGRAVDAGGGPDQQTRVGEESVQYR